MVLYTMYSEQFIFSEVTTSCIKGITVTLRKKFSEILKRVILQNPCQKSLCWIPFLINSQGWTLDLHFCWKEVSAKDKTSCGCIRIFSASSVRSNVTSGFSKIAGCTLQGCKTLLQHKPKATSFRNIFRKESMVKSTYNL